MKNKLRSIPPVLFLSGLFAAAPVFAASAPPTAWKGGTGLWQNSANWTAGIPSITATTFIDNGQTSVNSIVTLTGAGSARSITLDTGDQLFIGDNTAGANNTLTCQDFLLNGIVAPGNDQTATLTLTGNLTNNGTLFFNNNSIFAVSAPTVTNNGLIDIGEKPGDVLADAEFNSTNIAGGMSITGSGNISIHDGGTLSLVNPVTINSTGYINANSTDPCILIDASANITVAGITGTGPIAAHGGNSTLTFNTPANSTLTYAGAISGNISIIKNSTGTQIFTGNNTYTGTTDINAGTLEIDNANTSFGSGGAGYGNMTIHNTGTLAGTGSTACFVAIASGGTVSPGTAAGANAGTFTAGITLLLNSGSALKLDIGNAPGTSDLINISNGEFEASGVNVQFIPHGTLTYHKTYTFLNWSGALSLNGITPSAFTLLPSGVIGNFIVDSNADTVSFYLLADAGDANEDGKVDLSDLNIVLNHLGTTTSAWTNGNFDGTPTIDLTDLNDVLNNLGTTSIAPSTASVPEPTTLALLAAALPLLHRRRPR